jgi:polyferredoxin
MNKDLITKRFILFVATTLLSFFVPWQITIIILILAALLLPSPFEYIILVVGMFDGCIMPLNVSSNKIKKNLQTGKEIRF